MHMDDLDAPAMTMTDCIQVLVQAGADLHASGHDRSMGLLWHENLGACLGKRMADRGSSERDAWLMANVVYAYCDRMVLMRYCFEAEGEGHDMQFDFEGEGPDLLKPGHPGHSVSGAMDVFEAASIGRQKGWRQAWNPFSDSHSRAWDRAFEGVA